MLYRSFHSQVRHNARVGFACGFYTFRSISYADVMIIFMTTAAFHLLCKRWREKYFQSGYNCSLSSHSLV